MSFTSETRRVGWREGERERKRRREEESKRGRVRGMEEERDGGRNINSLQVSGHIQVWRTHVSLSGTAPAN